MTSHKLSSLLFAIASCLVFVAPMVLTERKGLWFIAMLIISLFVLGALVGYRHAHGVTPKQRATYVGFGFGSAAGLLACGALMAQTLWQGASLANGVAALAVAAVFSGLVLRRAVQLKNSQ